MDLPLTDEAAIHRLVDDILAYIFLLNATALDSNSLRHATTVASSQVCMRWRSIALHCHTIWGPIIDYPRHSLKWIETLLDRSHPSSLDIGGGFNTVSLADGGQSVLELVFNHIDRLRMVNLKVSESCWELVCSRFLQLPAPNLEFVKVIADNDSGPRQLTHPLFDHYAPNLQKLQLPRCTVDFTSPILTRLTDLYVADITDSSAAPTVLDWLNILGGMPSLRWLTLIRAISSAMTNDIYPIIQPAALKMLIVVDRFRESVTLVEHLIAPPRCGLTLYCLDSDHVGFDQRKICSIIENRIDSWTKNVPNRYLEILSTPGIFSFGNPRHELEIAQVTKAEVVRDEHLVDPVMAITLYLSNPQDTFPLLLSLLALFEWTFFDTTYLKLWIEYGPVNGPEVFLPLVDMFRGFVNLKKMCLECNSLLLEFLPLLQHSLPNSVLLPALQSLRLYDTDLLPTSNALFRVADFLRWRGEQGFPVQKIHISNSRINRQFILTHIQVQDTVVEMDEDYNCHFSE